MATDHRWAAVTPFSGNGLFASVPSGPSSLPFSSGPWRHLSLGLQGQGNQVEISSYLCFQGLPCLTLPTVTPSVPLGLQIHLGYLQETAHLPASVLLSWTNFHTSRSTLRLLLSLQDLAWFTSSGNSSSLAASFLKHYSHCFGIVCNLYNPFHQIKVPIWSFLFWALNKLLTGSF